MFRLLVAYKEIICPLVFQSLDCVMLYVYFIILFSLLNNYDSSLNINDNIYKFLVFK